MVDLDRLAAEAETRYREYKAKYDDERDHPTGCTEAARLAGLRCRWGDAAYWYGRWHGLRDATLAATEPQP